MIYSPDSNYNTASAFRPMNAFPFEIIFGMVAEEHKLTDQALETMVQQAANAIQADVEIGWLTKAIDALLCIDHAPFTLHDADKLNGAVESLQKKVPPPQFKVGQRIVADLACNNMPGKTMRGRITKIARINDRWVYYCRQDTGGEFSTPEESIIAFRGGK